MHNRNKERNKQGKEEGMDEGRRGGGNKKKKEGQQRLSDRSVHVKYYIDHLEYKCARILSACTQLHARTQRVSEYTHEYVYFQCVCVLLHVFCVRVRMWMCLVCAMCLSLRVYAFRLYCKYVLCANCIWAFCSSFCSRYCLLQLFAFRFLCFDFRLCCLYYCVVYPYRLVFCAWPAEQSRG